MIYEKVIKVALEESSMFSKVAVAITDEVEELMLNIPDVALRHRLEDAIRSNLISSFENGFSEGFDSGVELEYSIHNKKEHI